MAKEILKLQKGTIQARFDVKTYDEKTRTIDVVFATETLDVNRYDWRAGIMFIEQLVCSPENVRMDRLNNGAPFLDNHFSYGSVRDSLGKVVPGSGQMVAGKGRCKVQFSAREKVKDVIQDVRDGILTNISVGYNVFSYERQPYVDGETPVYRAIDWEPYEVSLVNIPADTGAGIGRSVEQIRGKEDTANELEVEITDAEDIETGTRSQEPPQNQPKKNHKLKNDDDMKLSERALAVGLPATATEAEVKAAELKRDLIRRAIAVGLDADAAEADIEAAERAAKIKKDTDAGIKAGDEQHARSVEIIKMVRTHKLPVEFGDKLIEDKTITIDQARAKIMDELAKTDVKLHGQVTVTGKDEQEKLRTAISTSMILRSGAIDQKLLSKEEIELGKEFRHHTLIELAKESLDRAKIDYKGLDKMEIAKRAITSHSSDFPVLLEGTNRRILLASYIAAPDRWREFCAVGSVGDFREWKRLRPGSFTRLDAVLEDEEYKNKKIPDAVSAGVSVGTFGNTISVSRKMIVNDDLNGFAMLAAGLGRAAKRSIEIDVFNYLQQNAGLGPVMKDGKTLFHVDHNNYITGVAAPSMAAFDAIRVKLGKQKDAEDNDYLDMEASILLTSLDLKGLADSINKSLYDPDSANKLQKPNIVQNMFSKVIGTPRVSGPGYYTFVDPAIMPVIEVSFLDGVEAPFMESHIPFNQDGIQWKIRMDYGVDAVETRGTIFTANA